MATTHKFDSGVLGVDDIGRWPLGGSVGILEDWDGRRSNLGDEQNIRGNLYTRVLFGAAASVGMLVMFDELFGALRDTAADNFDGDADEEYSNGARPIPIAAWNHGARFVKCGVVVGVDAVAGKVGYVQRRGSAVILTRRNAVVMGPATFDGHFTSSEKAGYLTPGTNASAIRIYGIAMAGLTAAGAANTEGKARVELCDPHAFITAAAAAVAQPDLSIPAADRGRPAYG